MHTHDKETEKFCSFSGTNTTPSTNLAGAHSNSYKISRSLVDAISFLQAHNSLVSFRKFLLRCALFDSKLTYYTELRERKGSWFFFGGDFYRLRRMHSIKSFFFQYATKVQNDGFIFMLQLTCLRCCETKSRKLIWFGLYED